MSDVQQRIRETVTNNPVVLYMKGDARFPQCGFSGLAVQILQACGAQEIFAVDVLAEPSASGATERTTCMRIREDTLVMSPRFFHPDYTVGSGISPDQPLARVAGFLPSPL